MRGAANLARMSDHRLRLPLPPTEPRMIRFQQYVAMVRRWDRDSLIRGAGWASAKHRGRVIVEGHPSYWLPWNIAGMAVTAICRGTPYGPTPTVDELRELVWQFGNIEDTRPSDNDDQVMRMLERLFHEQMPYQHRALHEWSRPQALFIDTPFPSDRQPEVMQGPWLRELLGGVTLPEYSATGFVLWAAAIASEGRFNPQLWDDASMAGFRDVLSRERIEEVGLAHFVTTIQGVKDARRAVPSLNPGSDKHAFNPLIGRPFLSDVLPDQWVAPSTDLIEQKVGVAGISYLGIDRWRTKFTRDLGRLFEAYVGRNLALITGARILGEVEFGTRRNPNKSTDWILVTNTLVVLIEVKASSPTESIRQSAGDLFSGVRAKLAEGLGQLNKTAAAIVDERHAFAEVPTDRPVVGLVVTLGNFPSAALAYRMGQLGASDIPIAFVSIGELEELVMRSADDVATVLTDGFATSDVPDLIENLGVLLRRSPASRNAIIDSAWKANPIMRFIKSRTSEATA